MSAGTDPVELVELADAVIGIVGRVDERTLIDALLDSAASGSSGAVVVAGPAGIGKSALLEYAVKRAAQFRVLHVAGVESEMAFGYAGVHQRVGPMLDQISSLADRLHQAGRELTHTARPHRSAVAATGTPAQDWGFHGFAEDTIRRTFVLYTTHTTKDNKS